MRFVMSSLVSVWFSEWTTKPPGAASMLAIAARTGTRCLAMVSASPVTRALTRTADPSGATRPASGGAVAGSRTWSNTGTGDPSCVTVSADSRATACGDERLERRIGRVQGRVADHEQDVLRRRVRAAGLEDGDGLRRLRLGLVRVAVGIVGPDAAQCQAQDEQADRPDEPGAGHGPAVTRAPHRDADGCGLPARGDDRRFSHGEDPGGTRAAGAPRRMDVRASGPREGRGAGIRMPIPAMCIQPLTPAVAPGGPGFCGREPATTARYGRRRPVELGARRRGAPGPRAPG